MPVSVSFVVTSHYIITNDSIWLNLIFGILFEFESFPRSPEIAEELTKAMAKSMALAGASGAEIAAAMRDALAANPHISKEEATQLLIGAVAASGASPEDIARAMYKMMADSGRMNFI